MPTTVTRPAPPSFSHLMFTNRHAHVRGGTKPPYSSHNDTHIKQAIGMMSDTITFASMDEDKPVDYTTSQSFDKALSRTLLSFQNQSNIHSEHCATKNRTVKSDTVNSDTVKSATVKFDTVKSDTVKSGTVQF